MELYHIVFSGFSCHVQQDILQSANCPYRIFEDPESAANFALELAQNTARLLYQNGFSDIHVFSNLTETTMRIGGDCAHWYVEEVSDAE